MSMVDRAGRKLHCSSGSICCASQKSQRRLATIFRSTLPAWETSEIPRKLLQSDRSDFLWSILIVASFHSCGISFPLHTRTRMAWKYLRTTGSRVGSSSLSSSTRSESSPGASQFAIARTAFCVSAYVGSAPSDIGSPIFDLPPGGGGGAFLRCCTFSTMDGFSCCCCCFSHSAHWLSARKKLLYTVANPSRGLLNRKKNKNIKSGSAPPPARCSFGENKKDKNKKSRSASMSRRYANRRHAGGLDPSRVRTRIPTTRRLGQWVSLPKILRFRVRLQLSQSRCLSLLLAMSGRVFLFTPPRGHEPPPTLRDHLNPNLSL